MMMRTTTTRSRAPTLRRCCSRQREKAARQRRARRAECSEQRGERRELIAELSGEPFDLHDFGQWKLLYECLKIASMNTRSRPRLFSLKGSPDEGSTVDELPALMLLVFWGSRGFHFQSLRLCPMLGIRGDSPEGFPNLAKSDRVSILAIAKLDYALALSKGEQHMWEHPNPEAAKTL